MTDGIRYSIVIPVYRNAGSISELVRRVEGLRDGQHDDLEAVFVVDGSPDESSALLAKQLARSELRAQVVELTRNFGSFSAIRAGMQLARGDFIAVMAADLQEPPEVILEFFDILNAQEHDVVIGRRTGRSDPALRSWTSNLYWTWYRRTVNPEIPPGGVDVFACTRAVAEQLNGLDETHTSLVGLLYWVGFRRSYVDYERAPRHEGSSAWTNRRRLRYMMDSIYAFTDLPLILLQAIGLLGILASTGLGAVVLGAWLMGRITEPGYVPLMIVILASTSAILLALGVVGSYVWRAYENGKGRPVALVRARDVYGN